jgi:Bacterial Ig-like domain (group 3)
MPYFARFSGRDSRRHPAPARFVLEALEERTMLSGTGASPATSHAVPVPLNVPTITTLQALIPSAEVGQPVPLVATVKVASTANANNAGKVEPMTGTVAFVTATSNPVVLGEVKLNKSGQALLSTKLLKNVGSNPITAEFLPANNYFAESTSAPIVVTINPMTVNAPTVTSLQAVTTRVETGESITLDATVQNADSSLANGVVEFVTVGRHPDVLGEIAIGTFGQQVSITTRALKKVGTYQIEAEYVPNTNRFATSASAPLAATITPLTAASFRVKPLVRHGHLGSLMSFTVTALNVDHQPLTNYTGTVVMTSPTDSWTVFPKSVYASMGLSPPPPLSTGLASFNPQTYTFTSADHGSHTFVNAATFGKGGAQILQVTQANDPEVFGKTTLSIG